MLPSCTAKYYRLLSCPTIIRQRCFCYNYCTKTSEQQQNRVRVRFAPSPTGYLHLGGLRTIVYNYLFARAKNGTFVLRIEDTDRKRVVEGSLDNLLSMMQWLGLEPNEGPGKYGGSFGPYFQSGRLDSYKAQAEKLLLSGHAYRCFCSEDRLMMLRNEALKNRQTVKYDSRCRHLKQSEIESKLGQGLPFVIRFKLEPIRKAFRDLIFGDYEYNFENVEGDFVLIKSDGYPTYHFANVVDDHFMQISHVLRGEEWLISTPKHLILYEAMGWSAPQYAHLPLILGVSSKTKLSKRQKDAFVEYYKDEGYYPLALVNSVCSTGRGFKDKEKEKLYELDELVERFDLESISRQSTRFEPVWLKRYNKIMIAEQKLSDQFLIDHLKELIRRKYKLPDEIPKAFTNVFDDNYMKKCLNFAKNRIDTLSDLLKNDLECLWTIPDSSLSCFRKKAEKNFDRSIEILKSVRLMFSTNYPAVNLDHMVTTKEFVKQRINDQLKSLAEKNEWPYPQVMQILRAAVCGCEVGLPVGEVFELLGKETVIQRLDYVLNNIDHTMKEEQKNDAEIAC